jgi:hypothetical protein
MLKRATRHTQKRAQQYLSGLAYCYIYTLIFAYDALSISMTSTVKEHETKFSFLSWDSIALLSSDF